MPANDGCDGSEGEVTAKMVDEQGLPIPVLPGTDRLGSSVLDYCTVEYADAKNLGEAIALRGHRAYIEDASPDDFMDDYPEDIEKVGIAELWSQSTWSAKRPDSRDVEMERQVAGLKEGDVLIVAASPKDITRDSGQNWLEIDDLGFGFYRDGALLPFTPYHDYDQDFFLDAMRRLRLGEVLMCVVREVICFGDEGVPGDPDFNWRIYSCKVDVCKINCLDGRVGKG